MEGLQSTAMLSEDVQLCMSELGEFLGSLVDGRNASFAEASFGDFFAAFHTIKKRLQDEELSVGVLALAKSGNCYTKLSILQ